MRRDSDKTATRQRQQKSKNNQMKRSYQEAFIISSTITTQLRNKSINQPPKKRRHI